MGDILTTGSADFSSTQVNPETFKFFRLKGTSLARLFRSIDGPQLRLVDEYMGWGIVIRGGLEVRRVPGTT